MPTEETSLFGPAETVSSRLNILVLEWGGQSRKGSNQTAVASPTEDTMVVDGDNRVLYKKTGKNTTQQLEL